MIHDQYTQNEMILNSVNKTKYVFSCNQTKLKNSKVNLFMRENGLSNDINIFGKWLLCTIQLQKYCICKNMKNPTSFIIAIDRKLHYCSDFKNKSLQNGFSVFLFTLLNWIHNQLYIIIGLICSHQIRLLWKSTKLFVAWSGVQINNRIQGQYMLLRDNLKSQSGYLIILTWRNFAIYYIVFHSRFEFSAIIDESIRIRDNLRTRLY